MALATIAQAKANVGAKLLVRRDGSTVGSLGAPEIDARAQAVADRVTELGKNEFVEASEDTSLFVEGFTTPPTLVLMGGGHIAKATTSIAKALGKDTDDMYVEVHIGVPKPHLVDKQAVLDSVRRTERMIVVSEDCKTGGAGAEIAATVAEQGFASLRAPIQRVCYPDMIVPGTVHAESLFVVDVKDIVAAAEKALGR